ncbi:hypothetical protein HDU93_003718 [Gonapodya sp. JEL0774]|nr:hypothetical protein HDU93_003718 [Gonapodya sp. JEL0774]
MTEQELRTTDGKKHKKRKIAQVESPAIATEETADGAAAVEETTEERAERKRQKKLKKLAKLAKQNGFDSKADSEKVVSGKAPTIKGPTSPLPTPSEENVAAYLEEHHITISEDGFTPILDLAATGFAGPIVEALRKFQKPTPIQSVTWAVAKGSDGEPGRDMVGIAQTGSGKTLAFGLPLLHRLHNHLTSSTRPKPGKSSSARPLSLILAPTRELAMQIHTTLEPIAKRLNLGCVCVYGGVPKSLQQQELRKGCEIVVATPGRLVDFLGEGTVELDKAVFAVLDEADRMLDMGFEKDVKEIMGQITSPHQTLYLSATWPPSVYKLASQFLTNPVHITVGSQDLAANKMIAQTVEVLEPFAKESRMFQLLEKWIGKGGNAKGKRDRVLVFALYKKEAVRLEQAISGRGYSVVSIHGDLTQPARTAALAKFKSGEVPLLVATDVAARGLDIPEVEYVLNFTFPLTIEDYVHRIGRTARAGRTGVSHTLFTSHDKAHSGALMNVLKDAGQDVPEDLKRFGGAVKKKVDKNFGAFFKEIDPNVKASHVKFDD